MYCKIGAVWLTFTILSLGVFNQSKKHEVSGVVKEIIKTEWDGYSRLNGMIETDDGKGNVFATLYKVGVETNDRVMVKISTGKGSSSFINASVMNSPTPKEK